MRDILRRVPVMSLAVASLACGLVESASAQQDTTRVPVGSVIAYAGSLTALSPDYRVCDGASFEAAKYPVLWRIIGDVWGKAAGVAGGRLPDLRGMFLRGVSHPSQVGRRQDWSTAMPSPPFITSDESNRHTHQASSTGHSQSGGGWASGDDRGLSPNGGVTIFPNTQGHTHTVLGGDAETRPTNVAVYWVIRVQ